MRRIPNRDRRFGSAAYYWIIPALGGDLLATDAEVVHMRERARKNPEDLPRLSWWRRAVVTVAGLVA
jgi:hypothetical protein